MNPDIVARQLKDIEGLDAIGIWPLAEGWWLLGLALVVVIWMLRLIWLRYGKGEKRAAWRAHARSELKGLRQQLARGGSSKEVTSQLSELLRRIAMARCGRDACAGLSGDAWLAWLKTQDPKGFDWPNQGRLLIELAYAPAPEDEAEDAEQQKAIRSLITAVGAWVGEAGYCPLQREQQEATGS
jgi:hypothetical protein